MSENKTITKEVNYMSLQELLLSDDIVKSINDNMADLLLIIPEIKYMIGFEHNHPHHHLDVWNHTLLALSLSEKNFDIRLCLLLHDIGKPFSYQEEEVRHFKNHAKVSANISRKILKRLEFDEDYINYICYLIEHHDTPISDEQIENNYDLCLKLLEIQRCDALAHNPNKLEKRKKYIEETHKKLVLKKGNNTHE
ncbi:MAG: HD domain-containing protein [Bacilli bacterium]|nr:HD domain-containing protein [Bacilli bacterium]